MKFNKIYFSIILGPLLLLTSCVTRSDGKRSIDPALMAYSAQEAAFIASSVTLKTHPELLPEFNQTRQGLTLLLAAGNFDVVALGNIIKSLPLKGVDGQVGMVVVGEVIAMWDIYGQRLMDLDKTASYQTYIKPVAEGFLLGLNRGMTIITVNNVLNKQ